MQSEPNPLAILFVAETSVSNFKVKWIITDKWFTACNEKREFIVTEQLFILIKKETEMEEQQQITGKQRVQCNNVLGKPTNKLGFQGVNGKSTSLAVCAGRMFCDKTFIFTSGPDEEQSINLLNHKAVLIINKCRHYLHHAISRIFFLFL